MIDSKNGLKFLKLAGLKSQDILGLPKPKFCARELNINQGGAYGPCLRFFILVHKIWVWATPIRLDFSILPISEILSHFLSQS